MPYHTGVLFVSRAASATLLSAWGKTILQVECEMWCVVPTRHSRVTRVTRCVSRGTNVIATGHDEERPEVHQSDHQRARSKRGVLLWGDVLCLCVHTYMLPRTHTRSARRVSRHVARQLCVCERHHRQRRCVECVRYVLIVVM
jgi:predicted fused transcriptional regulator/phosphomethylpyrimidine kinase